MSDHAVNPKRRTSFNSMRGAKGAKCVGCGVKLQTQKTSKSRFRSINIFSSDKSCHAENAYCNSCQMHGEDLVKKDLSISNQDVLPSNQKILLKEDPIVSIHDFFQRSNTSSHGENSDANVMSSEAYKLYSIVKKKLFHAFGNIPDDKRSIPTILCLMIHHPGGNPVRDEFYEIQSKYSTLSHGKNLDIDDIDIISLLVEGLKYFPNVAHATIMDAVYKISSGDGLKLINFSTFFLQKNPQDPIIQQCFHSLLKIGVENIESLPVYNIEKLSTKVQSLVHVNYANLESLREVLDDGIGTPLKDTVIFKKVFSTLRRKRFEYIIDAYRGKISSDQVLKDLIVDFRTLNGDEKEEMIPVLLEFSQILPGNAEDFQIIHTHLKSIRAIDKRSLPLALDRAMKGLSEHPTKIELTIMGCDILTEMGIPEALESNICIHICEVMDAHSDNLKMKKTVCAVLSHVQCPNNVISAMLVLHQIALSHEMDEHINSCMLSAFSKITAKKENAISFFGNVSIQVLSAQCRFPQSLRIQEQYCIIVSNLLESNIIDRKYALAVITHMINIIRSYSQHSRLQQASFHAMALLSRQYIQEVLSCDVIGLVVMGMVAHTDESEIQEAGCTILANVCPFIDIFQFGGIECILVAHAKHSDKKGVQYAACTALSALYATLHPDVHDNINAVKPLLEASKLTFPYECGDIVDRLMKTIFTLERPAETGQELKSDLEVAKLLPNQIQLSEDSSIDYAHTLIVVGSDKNIRTRAIKYLVHYPEAKCFRLRKNRDDFGLMDYVWYHNTNNPSQSNTNLALNILDLSEKVPPRLFFSQQASYVLLWDIEKIFDLDFNSCLEYKSDDEEDVLMDIRDDEAEYKKRIDKNIINWIYTIHEIAPNAEIFCLGVSKSKNNKSLEDREKCHMVRMRYEELSFERLSKGKSFSRANVAFEVAGDSIMYNEQYSNVINGLRNRILQSAQNEQQADVFMFDPIAEMGTKMVIHTVKQIGRKDVIMRWQRLLRSIREKLHGKETSMDVALHILLSRGEIRTFKVSLEGENREEIVVLNKEWLLEKARCIMQDEYEALKLSVEESKEDLRYSYEEHDFCKICVNCPIISSEDSKVLWQGMGSESKSIFALRCLEQILTKVGLLMPLKSLKREGHEKLFFIPGLLKSGEPPGWSFKSRDPKVVSISDVWALKTKNMKDLAVEMWRLILKQLYNDIDRHKFGVASNRSKGIWCTPYDIRNDHEFPLFIVHEICCWEACALFKIEVKTPNSKQKRGLNIIEIIIHFGGPASPYCLGTESLEKDEVRLSICYKGPNKIFFGHGSRILDRFVCAAEKVLRNHPEVEKRHECICPDCLAECPIADVAVFDWLTLLKYDHSTISCHRNHKMKVGVRN